MQSLSLKFIPISLLKICMQVHHSRWQPEGLCWPSHACGNHKEVIILQECSHCAIEESSKQIVEGQKMLSLTRKYVWWKLRFNKTDACSLFRYLLMSSSNQQIFLRATGTQKRGKLVGPSQRHWIDSLNHLSSSGRHRAKCCSPFRPREGCVGAQCRVAEDEQVESFANPIILYVLPICPEHPQIIQGKPKAMSRLMCFCPEGMWQSVCTTQSSSCT